MSVSCLFCSRTSICAIWSFKVFWVVSSLLRRDSIVPAAWSVGEKKDVVYEAGLYNLTQKECNVLIHYGKDQTRQMMLVRLEQDAAAIPVEFGTDHQLIVDVPA